MGRNDFCKYFEYGESDKGYWTYYCIFLQLEDCTDILKDLYLCIDFIS